MGCKWSRCLLASVEFFDFDFLKFGINVDLVMGYVIPQEALLPSFFIRL